MPIWVTLSVLWGLAGAIGVYAQDRTALIGGREAVARNVQGCRTRARRNRGEAARASDTAQRARKSMRRSRPCLRDRSWSVSACAARSESCQRIARRTIEQRQRRVSKLPPCAKSVPRPRKRHELEHAQSSTANADRANCAKAVAPCRPIRCRAVCVALAWPAERARHRLRVSLGLCIPDRDRLGVRAARHCRLR